MKKQPKSRNITWWPRKRSQWCWWCSWPRVDTVSTAAAEKSRPWWCHGWRWCRRRRSPAGGIGWINAFLLLPPSQKHWGEEQRCGPIRTTACFRCLRFDLPVAEPDSNHFLFHIKTVGYVSDFFRRWFWVLIEGSFQWNSNRCFDGGAFFTTTA